MRLIVFFDLPVKKKEEQRVATQFRNALIKDGYTMLQYSVYLRLCNGIESAYMHVDRLKSFAPNTGAIRCMVVTEKQFASMFIISGKKKKEEKPAKYIQLSFL